MILFDNRGDSLQLPPGAPFTPGLPDAIYRGQGTLALRGRCASLYGRVDGDILAFAASLGAEEAVLPGSLTLDDYRNCGYLDRFPQFTTLLSTGGVCSSAVCLSSYPCFEKTTFSANECLALTARGRAFRREALSPEEPERLSEFSMREIIFFGTGEYVERQLAACLDWLKGLVTDCEVHGVIQAAEDPFFCPDAEVLKAYQRATGSKLELQLFKPASPTPVAVASLNRHGPVFSKAFDIRFKDGNFLQTGCFAVGLERFVLVLGSYYGFDQSRWPSGLRQRLGEKP